jgi:hypothetical protein
MIEDLLLDWVSELGEGTWQEFRAAYEWLTTSSADEWRTPGFAMRMLSTLGHLEIDWTARRWAAAPPVLTILPDAGAHALLTGGRTRALKRSLHEVLADDDDLFPFEISQKNAPTAVWIECADETHVERLADALSIRYEYSVAQRLSRLVPSLDSYLAIVPSARCPKRYGLERFDVDTMRWFSTDQDLEPGLYQYDSYGPAMFRLIDDGEVFGVDLATGVYAALSRWGVNRLRYVEQSVNGELWVHLAAPLPTLHARTAALCTGLAPLKRGRGLVYRNVPRAIASRLARSLDQSIGPLEVVSPEGEPKVSLTAERS